MKPIRFWIVASALILVFLGSCKSFHPVEVGQPTDLKVDSFSGSKLNLIIFVPIKNPNIYRIRVTKITATAYINETKAGKIINREKINLPSNSDEIHKLQLNVDFTDLLSSGLSLMDIMRQGKVDVAIKGTLTSRSFLYKKEVPFSKARTLKLNN